MNCVKVGLNGGIWGEGIGELGERGAFEEKRMGLAGL